MTLSSWTAHPGAESWSTLESDLSSPCQQEPGEEGGGEGILWNMAPTVSSGFLRIFLSRASPKPLTM